VTALDKSLAKALSVLTDAVIKDDIAAQNLAGAWPESSPIKLRLRDAACMLDAARSHLSVADASVNPKPENGGTR
jgi:hypothetical protein